MSTNASAARANALKEALSYSSSLNHDADPKFQAFISRLLGLSLAVDPLQRRVKVSQTPRQRADLWKPGTGCTIVVHQAQSLFTKQKP